MQVATAPHTETADAPMWNFDTTCLMNNSDEEISGPITTTAALSACGPSVDWDTFLEDDGEPPVTMRSRELPPPFMATPVATRGPLLLPLRDISAQVLQQSNLNPKSQQVSPLSSPPDYAATSLSSSDSEPGPSVRRYVGKGPQTSQTTTLSPTTHLSPGSGLDIAKTLGAHMFAGRSPPSYSAVAAFQCRPGLSASPARGSTTTPSTTTFGSPCGAKAFEEDDCSSIHSSNPSSEWDSPHQGGDRILRHSSYDAVSPPEASPSRSLPGDGQVPHPPSYQQLIQHHQSLHPSLATFSSAGNSPVSVNGNEPTLDQIVSEQFQYSESQLSSKKLEEISSVDQLQERVGKVLEQRRLKELQADKGIQDCKPPTEQNNSRWNSQEQSAVLEFKNLRRMRVSVPPEINISVGDYCIVELDLNVGWAQGTPNPIDCGVVCSIWTPESRLCNSMPRSLGIHDQGFVLRVVNAADCKVINEVLPKFEEVAIKHTLQLIHFLHLPFKVVDTEYSFDRRVVRVLYSLDSTGATTTDVYVHRLQRELSTRLKCRVQLDRALEETQA